MQHIARELCDTLHEKKQKSSAILLLQASRDMRSIAAGPLRGPKFLSDILPTQSSKYETLMKRRHLSFSKNGRAPGDAIHGDVESLGPWADF